MENPTIELLRECTETTTEMLLEILVDIERSDVLDDILKFLKVDCSKLQLTKSSTEESRRSTDSSDMSLSWLSQNLGTER